MPFMIRTVGSEPVLSVEEFNPTIFVEGTLSFLLKKAIPFSSKNTSCSCIPKQNPKT